jgi:hypothetical protein
MKELQPPKEPWLLRILPTTWKRSLERAAYYFGGICTSLLLFGGVAFFFFWPLWEASRHPETVLGRTILWLRHAVGDDHFLLAYFVAFLPVMIVIVSGYTVFDYICFWQRHAKTTPNDRDA